MAQRWLWLLLIVAALFSGCDGPEPVELVTPAPSAAPEPAAAPVLAVNEETVTPGQEISVLGTGFPSDSILVLRLEVAGATRPGEIFAEIAVDVGGDFAATVTLPAHWPSSGAAVTERDLALSAVDPGTGESLATVLLRNATVADPGVYQPLPAAVCLQATEGVSATLGVDTVLVDAPFTDYITGQNGIGCQVIATGTGADFAHAAGVAMALEAMLADQGWRQDAAYAADGPTGVVLGLRRADELALLNVGWAPSESADCPSDMNLSACDLAPEQQIYTITLTLARTPAGTVAPLSPEAETVAARIGPDLMAHLPPRLAAAEIVAVEEVEWPDGCLGLPAEDELCTEAVVPGYRVLLATGDAEYVYRTDAEVTTVRLAIAPPPQIGPLVGIWKSPVEESPCTTAEIGVAGMAWGLCGGALIQAGADPVHAQNRAEFVAAYAPFTAETVAGRLVFWGEGEQEATHVEQRMIAEWARLAYRTAAGSGEGDLGVALIWQQRGGSDGHCEDLVVYVTGNVYASTCVGMAPEILAATRLGINRLTALYQWIDTVQGFEFEQTERSNGVQVHLHFAGAGEALPMEAETEEILAFAADLYAALTEAATPTTP